MGHQDSSTQQPLTVGQAGEDHVLGLVRALIDPFNADRPPMSVGLGDDAAVLHSAVFGSAGGDPSQWVFTTDTASEDQDFRARWWMGPGSGLPAMLDAAGQPPVERYGADVGTKAAAQNLSDLNAMGATPKALLISVTLPANLPVAWVQGFYRGVIAACTAPGAEHCVIAGGDLGSGEQVSVTITAVGWLAPGQQPLVRSGARPSDVVAVCGRLGAAAAGLAVLESQTPLPAPHPDEDDAAARDHANPEDAGLSALIRHCVAAQLRPRPPLGSGRVAVDAGAVAGMDLSDGLARDVPRIASASGVAVRYHREYLQACAADLAPVAAYLGLPEDAAGQWVSTGGEDFSLLAVFPPEAELPDGFTVIGEVTARREASDESPHGRTGTAETSLPPGAWDSLRG